MPRRFWMSRTPLRYRVRVFGYKRRYPKETHFGLSLKDRRRFMMGRKRRNPFVKQPQFPFVDRYGRPPNHPRFQKPEISNCGSTERAPPSSCKE